MRGTKYVLIFVLVGFGVLLQACGRVDLFNPETVISNAIETEEVNISYYGELLMTSEAVDELDNITLREWRDGKAQRVEMDLPEGLLVTVTDGETLFIYEESEKEAYYSDDDSLQQMMMDPREELDMVLELVEDTHDMKTIGEEEIAGRKALQIDLTKQKGEKSLFGDQKLWIDKENWVVLKMISINGNAKQVIEYTHLDFNAEIDQSKFQLDLPDGVELENVDDINFGIEEEEISIKDIPDKMEQAIYYFSDNHKHQIDKVTYTEMEDDPVYKDVTIDYKQDGLPLFTFSILSEDEEDEAMTEEESELLKEIIEYDSIRNQEAMITDIDPLRSISWSEEGIRYSIDIIDPSVSWETIKQWAEEMDKVN